MRTATAPRRALIACLIALTAVPAAAAPAASAAASAGPHCRGADRVPTRTAVKQARKATLCLLNAQRRRHGLHPLRANRALRRAAKRHSVQMRDRGFFEHTSPGGATVVHRVRSAGYIRGVMRYSVGENIGWGQAVLATPRQMVRGWMRSPGHRANILRPQFRHVGVGVAIGVPGGGHGATYTTDFGSRSS